MLIASLEITQEGERESPGSCPLTLHSSGVLETASLLSLCHSKLF